MKRVEMTVEGFVNELASSSPAPCGGCVAALSGAQAAALVAMAARKTLSSIQFRGAWGEMEQSVGKAERLLSCFLGMVDEDAAARSGVLSACHPVAESPGEDSERSLAVQAASKTAAGVSLQTLRAICEMFPMTYAILERGHPSSISDIGTAVALLKAGAKGAAYNVRFNLSGVAEPQAVDDVYRETQMLLDKVIRTCTSLETKIERGLD